MKPLVSTALLLVWIGLLLACTSTPPGQAVGHQASRDGIGGTGQPLTTAHQSEKRPFSDGIGGTGRSVEDGIGGTGIIGSITGFGSIWIHNAHVFIDAARITANGEKARRKDLRLGQVVAVLSDRKDNGYEARSIDIVYEVIAPVTAIDTEKQRITALGQVIHYGQGTMIADARGAAQPSRFRPSQWIKVSGLRQKNGEILASRIDLIEPREEVQLIGEVQGHRIAGYPAKLANGVDIQGLSGRIRVAGMIENGVLVIRKINPDAISMVIKQASEVLFEGFLLDPTADSDILEGSIELVLPYDDTYFITDSIADDLSAFPEGADFGIEWDDSGEYMEDPFLIEEEFLPDMDLDF